MDLGELSFDVVANTSGLKTAAPDVESFAESGKNAESAARDMGDESQKAGKKVQSSGRDIKRATDDISKGFGGITSAIKMATAALVAFGVQRQFQAIIDEQELLQRNMLRTEAIVKATGATAGFSADQLAMQARMLARNTLQSTEGVMQAQQVLLSFRRVSGDTFTRATELAADLATVTGGNLTSSMQQLGRALEDPVQGITALRRSGVSFTDQQKDTIAALVETNDLAAAQKLILDELAAQYGGVSRAEAQGLAGAQDTLAQSIQEARIAIADFLGVGDRLAGLYGRVSEAMDEFTARLASGELALRVKAFFKPWVDGFNTLVTFIGDRLSVISGLMDRWYQFLFRQVGIEVKGWWDVWKQAFGLFADAIMSLPDNFADFVRLATTEILSLVDRAKAYGSAIAGYLDPRTWFSSERQAAIDTQLQADLDFVNTIRSASIEAIMEERRLRQDNTDRTIKQGQRLTAIWKAQQDEIAAAAWKAGEIPEAISDGADAAGECGADAGVAFTDEFLKKVDRIADGIQNAIMTGDFQGLGQTIGGVLSGEISSSVATSLAESIGGQAGMILGPIGGAIAGGLVGSLFGGESTPAYERAQKRQGRGTVFGDDRTKTESIVNATQITADATRELVGINRDMLGAMTRVQSGIDLTAAQIARQGLGFGDALGSTLREGLRITGGIEDADVEARRKGLVPSYGSTVRRQVDVSRVDESISDAIQSVLDGIADSAISAASTLGVSSDQINKAIEDFALNIRVDLTKMNAEEQAQALTEVFGAEFDKLAGAIAPHFAEMQRVGEGFGETLVRLAANVDTVTTQFDRLGIVTDGVGAGIATALIEASGGIGQFSADISAFISGFRTDAQQLDILAGDLTRALGQINLALPETREQFGAMVDQALAAVTEESADATAQLLRLATTADDYYSRIEQAETERLEVSTAAADQRLVLEERLFRLTATADQQRQRELESIDESNQALQLRIWSLEDAAQAERELAAEQQRINAERMGLERQLLQLQGDTAALRALDLASIDESNRELQQRIWALQDAQAAEKELRSEHKTTQRTATSAARAVSSVAQMLNNELNGVRSALQSLRGESQATQDASRRSALDVLRRAVLTGDLRGTGEAAGIAAQIDPSRFSSAEDFAREQGRTVFLLDQIEREGVQQLSHQEQQTGYLKSIDRSLQRISFGQEVPGFASGGAHMGGLRIVGERGPEIEATGPARIMSNGDIMRALGGSNDAAEELKRLRADMNAVMYAVAKNTSKTARQLERWDAQGLPEERDVEA